MADMNGKRDLAEIDKSLAVVECEMDSIQNRVERIESMGLRILWGLLGIGIVGVLNLILAARKI